MNTKPIIVNLDNNKMMGCIYVKLIDKIVWKNKINESMHLCIRTIIVFKKHKYLNMFIKYGFLESDMVFEKYLNLAATQSNVIIMRILLEYIADKKYNKSTIELEAIKKTSIYYELKYSIKKYGLPIKLKVLGDDTFYTRKVINIM